MEGKRTIEKIRLRNILSFGDKGEEIELQPLNVLIGQNASGKSNFIDIFKLLRSLTQDKGLASFINRNGGISEWIWKGKSSAFSEVGTILTNYKDLVSGYSILFQEVNQRLNPILEVFKYGDKEKKKYSSLGLELPTLNKILSWGDESETDNFDSIQRVFSTLRTYTDLQSNRSSEIRKPQFPDEINDFLEENGSNLALVLNDLEHRGDTKDKIVSYLKKFNPRIKDYSIRILGGTVQLFVREEGLEKPISAMRLSDGTLRYLCLLAILCHPEPPPLICLEEPEVGLHPDILPTIAELLIDASQRTQLIVTTHSDILVSALSDVPEAVLVCEADEDGTHLKRLDKENLKEWLDEYNSANFG